MIINFLLVLSIVGVIAFFYTKDISVIEKNGYADLSNRLIGNHEIENIEAYINKNNINYIKVNAKNLDLNRIAQLSLDNSQNITFQVIDSQDNVNATILTQLVKKYKQIILGETIKDYTQILKQNGNNYEIHLGKMSNDFDLFQILFLLKNKNIDKLQITGFNTLKYYQVFFRYFMNTDNIKELSLFDTFEFDQYMFFHEYARNLNKKLFFSPKKEILSLKNMKNPPKDLLLDYIPGGLEVKDILDIHTIFGDYEFDLLSSKQNIIKGISGFPPYFKTYEEKYTINIEFLNKNIHYKKANLVGYNIKFNKGLNICKLQKFLYVSNIQDFTNDKCLTHYFSVQGIEDNELFHNEEVSIFIKAIFDFMISKENIVFISDFADQYVDDNSFEEFWLLFNSKEYFYKNKSINPDNINNIASYLVESKNNKEKFKILYKDYISELNSNNVSQEAYGNYFKYNQYLKVIEKEFSIKYLLSEYFEYLQGKKDYYDLPFFSIDDNTKNNGILIFYTKKDE